MYKAIFIDIDGTLRDDNNCISNRTKLAIKAITNKGILVVVCSGRPRKYTENISKECWASKYIITSNGANIYDYENKRDMYVNKINTEACLKLYKIAEDANVRFIMNVGDNRVVNKLKYFDGTEEELKEDITDFLKQNEVAQCVIADNDFDKIANLKDKIESIKGIEIQNQHKSLTDANVPREGTIYYDIANVGACKGNAVKMFCQMLNIDLKDTIAIGDGYNDISMFDTVGHSIAMGNAKEEIKKSADEVTLSNNENGVAVYLEKILNNYMQ